MKGYFAAPRPMPEPLPAVVVIHENRGLNAYVEDVARRLATAAFVALAPDFLTPLGGRPAGENQARQMIAKLDAGQTARKRTRLYSRHYCAARMPYSA